MTISFGLVKRPFLIAIAALSVVVLGLLIAVIVLAIPKTQKASVKDTANYCFKSHCLSAASEILESINTSVNPCDDFYAHTCGSWINTQRIPPDEKSIGTFKTMQNIVSKRLVGRLKRWGASGHHKGKDIVSVLHGFGYFQSPQRPSSGVFFYIYTKFLMYKRWLHDIGKAIVSDVKIQKECVTCVKGDAIEKNSGVVIKNAISELMYITNQVELINTLIQFQANYLLPVSVGVDEKNVTRHIISVTRIPLILGPPRYYNQSTPGFTALRNLIDGFSDLLGGNFTDAIIDYELKLKDIYTDLSPNKSENYNLMTIEELHNHTQDKVNWLEILKQAVNNSESSARVDEKTEILVYIPDYINKLADILNGTDIKTLISYAAVRYMLKNMNAMPAKYRKLYLVMKEELYSVKASPPRENVCASNVQGIMPGVVGRLYVDNFFPESSKKRAILLVRSLRDALEKMFKSTKWMDDVTRLAAIEKVESVLSFVGYRENIKDDSQLGLIFQLINFTKDGYLENIIKIQMLYGHYAFHLLETPNDRTSGILNNPAVVNAFYSPTQNSIIFPAGILQPPIYDEQYPLSMLFGAMGAVVGHEFTHGFDNQGAQYDEVGNLKNWWTQNSMENFRTRADGLRQQYSNFSLCKTSQCDLHINGNLTLGENIADNGGVKASFKAYKEYVKDHNVKTMTLPGLSYTSDQLFFIGFAHVWCLKIQPKAFVDRLLTDPHSPAVARVIVTLRNSEAFSTAFKCKKDSSMNPNIKYGVW